MSKTQSKSSELPDRIRSGRQWARTGLREPALLYLSRLQTERGYSEHTLQSYRQALVMLCEYAGEVAWVNVSEADVRNWVARMAGGGLSARSIAHRLSVWRGFFEFVGEQGTDGVAAIANPARVVRAPRIPKRLPKALSPDMAHQLSEYEPEQNFADIRDKAMLELFYSSGLRLSEFCGLDYPYADVPGYRSTSWLDLSEAQVTVLGKGRKTRTVPVGAAAMHALTQWIAALDTWRLSHPTGESHALFISVRSRRLSPRSVQVRLKRLALRRGVPANVHPHVLRHSFASHLLQSSGDLRAVQELLGHASIATTQIYTALDFQRLAKVYDEAHPRARKAR